MPEVVQPRRPRLALPFSILAAPDEVWLVGGEDFRFRLQGPGLDHWLPALLARVDGRTPLAELLEGLPAELGAEAQAVFERLRGERMLLEGPVEAAWDAAPYHPRVEGHGHLREVLESTLGTASAGEQTPALRILCQDTLDWREVARFNRQGLAGAAPFLWATIGPAQRGYVSPIILPDAGPCLGCLVRGFRRLSPAPEVYEALDQAVDAGQALVPAMFPERGLEILARLVLWKVEAMAQAEPPRGLFRLHVLEREELEVSAHRVMRDPECPDCQDRR